MRESLLIIDDPRFEDHRARDTHPERPERLAAARAGLEVLPGVARRSLEFGDARPEEIERVHRPGYAHALDEALAHGWGHLDPDTFFSPGSRQATWLAAGAAARLGEQLVRSPGERALALLRPPGHHARPGTPMGFCLVNNVAVAAAAARAAGAARVAIVDWDVHHGNGTQEIFQEDPSVLFVSLHQSPFYPGTGAATEIGTGAGRGTTVNVPFGAGTGDEAYGAAFREVVLPRLRAFAPEVVFVSAGFDAHARDPLAQLELQSSLFGAMTTALDDLCGDVPLALLLEGGYDLQALADSVRSCVDALTGRERPALPEGEVPAAARTAIERTLAAHAPQD